MDELGEKLAGILSDPESMERVRNLAQSLFSEEKPPEKAAASGDFLSPEAIKGLMGVMSKLNSSAPDNRSALLMALKPHLSEKRQHRVDSAVKLLRLIQLLPALKESGIIDF